ncbi:flagellar protein FlhE [Micromonospora sp. NBS 11-29]|uniref:flagellar protein FlhE n=1 Tax=Micromonospora sp. NBS 11-29 TaxID=1960879 RepID=UPI001123FEF6|nr:flagellar protein FlhE [Micromonospora sp. NBS 11-29]
MRLLAIARRLARVHRPAMLGAALALGLTATLAAPAAPALAATSSWSQTQNTLNPTIYQTNFVYYSTPFTAPSTPAGATITSVSFAWTFLYIPPPYPASPYQVYLCAGPNGTQCAYVSPSWSAQSYSGTTTAFQGFPAGTTFQYAVYVQAPTTFVLPYPYKPSKTYSLTVNYTY